MLHVSKAIGLLILSVALLPGCGGSGGDGENNDGGNGGRAKWTYMVYMGADNNLSNAGLGDLNEMEAVGSNSDVNIVLQAEFSNQFTNFSEIGHGSYAGETLRFRVVGDNNPNDINLEAGASIGNVDMGAPATLTSFIQWAANTYPADNYALVIWDHGAGWKKTSILKGAVEDATSSSWMSLPDLAQAVSDSGVSLNLINFDACLMGMYEVAYEFLTLTDYMVFSEETEPGQGDPYDTILAALKANPDMSGAVLSGVIVDKYVEYYQANGRADKITKSAVDMSAMTNLDARVTELADSIVTNYTTVSGVVETARQNSQSYEYTTNLDLYDFSSRLFQGSMNQDIQTKAQAVMDAVSSAVIANRTLDASVADSHGLAIYLPGSNQVSGDQTINDLRDYAILASNTNRATSWLNVVEKTTEQSGDTTLVEGGFGFYIEWNTDADVDLYVCEPNGLCYAPWNGQTSPNGNFSGDSYDTGYTEEYYMANDYVQSGYYDVFIEYYGNGAQLSYADVTFWFLDPDTTNGQWESMGPVNLDFSDPEDFNNIPTFDDLNNYSNFWYPGWIERTNPQAGTATINTGSRQINVVLKRAKKVQHETK